MQVLRVKSGISGGNSVGRAVDMVGDAEQSRDSWRGENLPSGIFQIYNIAKDIIGVGVGLRVRPRADEVRVERAGWLGPCRC